MLKTVFCLAKKSNATQQENRFFYFDTGKCPDLKENYVDFDQKSHFHCRGLVKTRLLVLKTLEVLNIENRWNFPGAEQNKSTQNSDESGKNRLDDTPPTGSFFLAEPPTTPLQHTRKPALNA